MNNSIAGANDAVKNTSSSIGVAKEIVLFFSLYNGKPNEALDPLRYLRFCEQAVRLYMVSLKTGKAVQADLCRMNLNGAERLRMGKCYPSRFLCHLHP